MKRVLLTGMSGTGKSALIRELAALGHEVATDAPLAEVVARVLRCAGDRL